MSDSTKGSNSVYKILGASNHTESERESNDYYATEPYAVELLLEEETFSPNIWECACGELHITNVLKNHGYDVKNTDLVDRLHNGDIEICDFLTCDETWNGDIITNPPYKFAKEFVEHAIELVSDGRKVAMFLRLQFLEGKARGEMFKRYPPKTVYVSSSRLDCAKNGDFESAGQKAVAYAWFVWEKGFNGDPIIKWIN